MSIEKISFGGIPNSSSIDILMPYAIFDYMGAFLRSSFAHVDNVIPVIKTITWLLCQGCKATNHTGTLRNLPNPPEPSSGTYTNTRRNSPEPSGTFRDLPEPTFWNLSEPTSWTYASIHRNPPKSSGTCLRNLHHFTPELPEPASGTYTSTLWNSPEPSGTFLRNLPCSCNPHRHTPELIWAEDPISLRCWGISRNTKTAHNAQSFSDTLGPRICSWSKWVGKSLVGKTSSIYNTQTQQTVDVQPADNKHPINFQILETILIENEPTTLLLMVWPGT